MNATSQHDDRLEFLASEVKRLTEALERAESALRGSETFIAAAVWERPDEHFYGGE